MILNLDLTKLPPETMGATWTRNNERRLVNSRQAAAIAGIAPRTLRLWVHLGKVEVIRTAGGQLRIFADTLFQRDPRGRRSTRVIGASRS